jgi:Raf kinase inhibitor-like YbhB/YbcL family protein
MNSARSALKRTTGLKPDVLGTPRCHDQKRIAVADTGGKESQMKFNLLRLLVLTMGLGTIDAAMAQENTAPPQLTLSSPTVKDMEPLPLKYSQTGTRPSIVVSPGMNNGAVNPPIEWSNVPPGTNAFVLIVLDHIDTLMWAVVNIPGNVRALPEGIPNGNESSKLPAGAFHRSFRSNGWIGPAARQNPEGRWTYYWKLYPLDRKLNVPEDASLDEILVAMEGHLTGNKAVMITPCCDGSK